MVKIFYSILHLSNAMMTSREQVQDYVHGYPLSKDELHRRSGVGEVAERHFYSHPHTHLPNNVSRNTKKKNIFTYTTCTEMG